jgi:hypothetical protein
LEITMPQGAKSAYTDKQKRQVRHMVEDDKKEGPCGGEAQAHARAAVNKTDGGDQAGAGRKKDSAK